MTISIPEENRRAARNRTDHRTNGRHRRDKDLKYRNLDYEGSSYGIARDEVSKVDLTVSGDLAALQARPNFLVVGAAKSGTTSLWHYLRQHPEIYMSPRKHTRFFAYDVEDPGFRGPAPLKPALPYAITDPGAYHALFAGVTDETAIGEASHSYLYRPQAAGRIQEYAPGMKLVAVLRNPVERAYSHYRQMVRDGREPIADFFSALREEAARVEDHWWPDFHYARIGLYYSQLEHYFDLFDRDQIRVYLYEDLNSNPRGLLRDLFGFLEVAEGFVPELSIRYNASGVPKNRAAHALLQRLRIVRPFLERALPRRQVRHLVRLGASLHNRNLVNPPLSPEVRARITDEYFREDILKLQALIRRDISAWLE